MPGDLFAGTFERKAGPRRSKWTIAGSFIAHTLLLGALLVLPVLSAFDSYVVHARNMVFVPRPAVIPASPAAPPKAATPVPNEIKLDAAPVTQAQNEVIRETVPAIGPPGPPGLLPPMSDGTAGIPGGKGDSVIVPPTPPPPVVQKPVRPGGDIHPPTRISYIDPVYPHIAVQTRTEGRVILEATIDEAGAVKDVKVLRSIALLDQAAMDAVKRWRYTPTKLNGVAVPILLTVTVTFSLR